MLKKLIAVLLTVTILMSLLPTVSAQEEEIPQSVDRCCYTRRIPETKALARPTFTGKLLEITPRRVEDTFRYLDDFYVQTHPEAALELCYGTEEDRAVLLKLAQIVTEGCTTQKEMADAVSDWVARNIFYEVNTSAYASDTFYRREGNCLSYAFLIQTMLRSLGIPAVLGDGWRGDMAQNTVDLFNYEGHAWVFVYLNGQWELYDPLWLTESTTDRDYMAKWIYFDTVEFVCPAYDEENLPPEAYDKHKAYFTGENIYLFSNGFPKGVGNLTCFINNIAITFLSNQCDEEGISDGMYYLDGVTDKTQMVQGQVYTNGWLSYGDYYKGKAMLITYAHANGMLIDGSVMAFDGRDYLMYSNDALPICAEKEEYSITDGLFTLPTGYTGKFLATGFGEKVLEGSTLTVENMNPEVAVTTVDGTISCLSEGYAAFRFTLTRDEDNALMGYKIVQVKVSDELRVADFTDHVVQEPDPTEPDPTEPDPTEPDPSEPDPSEPVETDPTEPTPTESEPAESVQPTEPEESMEPTQKPTEPEIPTENPFTDVKKDDYFATPVLWAVGKNITNGMSATSFAPNAPCTRGQIVTFLWRACGSPEPAKTYNPFKDVKANEYYYKAVLWAVEKGITTGLSATSFGPNVTCTRGQVATFLWRSQGNPAPKSGKSPFADVRTGDYYYEAVLWAVENDVTQGTGGGKFSPNASCSRGQIVTFLYRSLV